MNRFTIRSASESGEGTDTANSVPISGSSAINLRELDALEPSVLAELVSEKVKELRDPDLWEKGRGSRMHIDGSFEKIAVGLILEL